MQSLVFLPTVRPDPSGYDFGRLPTSLRPLVVAPPAPECELCVVIPAHNEEAGIVGTLSALAAQTDRAGKPLDRESYEIIVLANNCRDRTAALTGSSRRRTPGCGCTSSIRFCRRRTRTSARDG